MLRRMQRRWQMGGMGESSTESSRVRIGVMAANSISVSRTKDNWNFWVCLLHLFCGRSNHGSGCGSYDER
ncbi:hypothetical protein L6164_015278 [Bauhinia variegata]|uniref:Uncharacterized protein n=1 Tax=Bauhinia variegata TaxID=167791 RepID=A0ACB9NM15_BAUVA|nr:hypothetical protein L6164_015278 [Bauhinia variegata]